MARVVVAALLLGLGLGLVSGCSGKVEDDDDDEVDPVLACRTYASTWCNKAFGCYVQVGRLDESLRQGNVDTCVSIVVDKLPCSAASSLGDDYDKCISQIKGMACSKWDVPQTQFGTVRPPASCDNALNYE
jgi:hypothetical protein